MTTSLFDMAGSMRAGGATTGVKVRVGKRTGTDKSFACCPELPSETSISSPSAKPNVGKGLTHHSACSCRLCDRLAKITNIGGGGSRFGRCGKGNIINELVGNFPQLVRKSLILRPYVDRYVNNRRSHRLDYNSRLHDRWNKKALVGGRDVGAVCVVRKRGDAVTVAEQIRYIDKVDREVVMRTRHGGKQYCYVAKDVKHGPIRGCRIDDGRDENMESAAIHPAG